MVFDNETASKRAQFLIDQHRANTGLSGDDETVLCHLLADLIEWSDEKRVDFDLQVENAREFVLTAS
jgi:hypothetical protein